MVMIQNNASSTVAFKTLICFAEQTLFVKKKVMFVYHIEYNIH